MRFVLTIDNMDNAAFDPGTFEDEESPDHGERNGYEVARILKNAAEAVESIVVPGDNGILRDINGNRVGSWKVEED